MFHVICSIWELKLSSLHDTCMCLQQHFGAGIFDLACYLQVVVGCWLLSVIRIVVGSCLLCYSCCSCLSSNPTWQHVGDQSLRLAPTRKTPKNRVHAAQVTFCPPPNHQLETHFARDPLISITIRSSSSHQQIPCVRTHWHLIAEPLLSSSRCFRNIFGLLLLGCPERWLKWFKMHKSWGVSVSSSQVRTKIQKKYLWNPRKSPATCLAQIHTWEVH